MKAKIGTFLMIIGSVLIFAALGLFIYNEHEQNLAAESVSKLMPQLVEAIRVQKEETSEPVLPTVNPQKEMKTAEIDGHEYIGFVGIPALGLELPVMADWDYDKLKIAPCRYSGSVFTGDLVVMAHNYKKHFGSLSTLRPGDSVTFTDMEGQTLYYEVAALDVLSSTAVEDMTSGEFDFTLFTCTYGGESRVTVRCDRTSAE
ncbi:MAG: sortase [Oscillospiraceae bacterium]|nr:sortase [Oscillospiraceae bacterium]MBQ2861209.1 sortase [Oscillospiraceae bacterium]MBQ2998747.1 sortase [Oscillospiraceae bacterium]MBQ3561878.1 sortase [Oscillospiraceae bacterium]MBQ6802032.1 sortase [Oscillospiraceae bacterium]